MCKVNTIQHDHAIEFHWQSQNIGSLPPTVPPRVRPGYSRCSLICSPPNTYGGTPIDRPSQRLRLLLRTTNKSVTGSEDYSSPSATEYTSSHKHSIAGAKLNSLCFQHNNLHVGMMQRIHAEGFGSFRCSKRNHSANGQNHR